MLKVAAAVFVCLLIGAPILLRLHPRWVAAFNLVVTNRITGPFATSFPGFGVLTHVGRKSGRQFRTPVNVFRAPEGFLFALTYGPNSQWVQNVLAAGRAELVTQHRHYNLSSPEVIHDPSRQRFPLIVRGALRILGADYFLRCHISN